MFIFSVTFLPLIMLFLWSFQKDKAALITSVAGITGGVITCLWSALFSHLHNVFQLSFIANFMFLVRMEFVLPVIIWYAFYFLVTKDDVRFKLKNMFFFVLGFYMVYIPFYTLFSGVYTYSFYELFMKPVIMLSACLILRFCMNRAVSSFDSKKRFLTVVYSILALADFFVPAAFEALWITRSFITVLMISMVVYILCGAVLSYLNLILQFRAERSDRSFAVS